MGNLEIRTKFLIFEIGVKEKYVRNLLIVLDSYRLIKNTYYIAAGNKQTEKCFRLGEKYSQYVRRLEEIEILIVKLKKELNFINIILNSRNTDI